MSFRIISPVSHQSLPSISPAARQHLASISLAFRISIIVSAHRSTAVDTSANDQGRSQPPSPGTNPIRPRPTMSFHDQLERFVEREVCSQVGIMATQMRGIVEDTLVTEIIQTSFPKATPRLPDFPSGTSPAWAAPQVPPATYPPQTKQTTKLAPEDCQCVQGSRSWR